MKYYSDNSRHLVCIPFSIQNLHKMADDLKIKRCWFHLSAKYPHYDIPQKRISEIQAKTLIVTPQEIIKICKGEYENNA